MQVQNISSNNYKNRYSPNFGLMNVTEKGQKYLDSLWYYRPECVKNFNALKKRLNSTNYFDLVIDATNDNILMKIIGKKSNCKSCQAPLLEYFHRGNRLEVSGRDMAYSEDNEKWVNFYLEFPSEEEATTAKNDIDKYQYKNKDTYETIEWAVKSIEILEKAFKYMKNPKIEKVVEETPNVAEVASSTEAKLPIRQRLKNAWLALKG